MVLFSSKYDDDDDDGILGCYCFPHYILVDGYGMILMVMLLLWSMLLLLIIFYCFFSWYDGVDAYNILILVWFESDDGVHGADDWVFFFC